MIYVVLTFFLVFISLIVVVIDVAVVVDVVEVVVFFIEKSDGEWNVIKVGIHSEDMAKT
jgi:hypothetical protein